MESESALAIPGFLPATPDPMPAIGADASVEMNIAAPSVAAAHRIESLFIDGFAPYPALSPASQPMMATAIMLMADDNELPLFGRNH